jgi:hypothetical protein
MKWTKKHKFKPGDIIKFYGCLLRIIETGCDKVGTYYIAIGIHNAQPYKGLLYTIQVDPRAKLYKVSTQV